MRIRNVTALLITAWLSSTHAATHDEFLARVNKMHRELNGSCRYPILEKNKQAKETMCVLDALRARCNKIDDCYVYCIGNDVGVEVGGGCAHLCNYGLRAEWEAPKGMEACMTK